MDSYIIINFILGATLTLNGISIPTDGSGRININDSDLVLSGLICQSNATDLGGEWYRHPTQQSTEEEDRIVGDVDQSWSSNRSAVNGSQIVILRRTNATAQEGVFTCYFPNDSSTPISVGIYYPSESMAESDTYTM